MNVALVSIRDSKTINKNKIMNGSVQVHLNKLECRGKVCFTKKIVNWWVFIECGPKSSQLKEPKT